MKYHVFLYFLSPENVDLGDKGKSSKLVDLLLFISFNASLIDLHIWKDYRYLTKAKGNLGRLG